MGGAADTVSNTVTGAADAVGGVVQGGVDAVGSAGQSVVDLTKDIASSDLGKAAIIGGAAYMGADALGGSSGMLGDAGAADVATTAAVADGVVTETPLGSLTADAGSAAAEAGAGAAAVDTATGGGGGAAASVGASEQIGEKLSGNMGTSAIADYALTAGGTAALMKAVTPQVVQQSSVSGQTTTPSIDFTANEKRASADEISNVMAFQSTASQRTRMTGASVLANNAGSASTGTKKLLGA